MLMAKGVISELTYPVSALSIANPGQSGLAHPVLLFLSLSSLPPGPLRLPRSFFLW